MISTDAELRAKHLQLIAPTGVPGLAEQFRRSIRVLHQRYWVQKMRNIREKAAASASRRAEQMGQVIYLAEDRKQARAGFRRFKLH